MNSSLYITNADTGLLNFELILLSVNSLIIGNIVYLTSGQLKNHFHRIYTGPPVQGRNPPPGVFLLLFLWSVL